MQEREREREREQATCQERTKCPLCGHDDHCLIYAEEKSFAVSGDSRPVADASRVWYCKRCACFFRDREHSDQQTLNRVYHNYALYEADGHDEARVAFDLTPDGIPKSVRELDFLSRFAELPPVGRVLDYGCNYGLLLRAFLERHPDWQATGADIEEKYREGFTRYLPGSSRYCLLPEEDPGDGFDLVCCSHVLEHLPDPLAALQDFRARLQPGGLLFLQAVNPLRNPFFHVIYEQDHHFTPQGLARLLARCGLRVLRVDTDWIGKEISVLALRPESDQALPADSVSEEDLAGRVQEQAAHVRAVEEALARIVASRRQVGIFGASIMGSWLAARLSGQAVCFVDENATLQGSTHLGLPILPPAEAPRDLPILCALPQAMAERVVQRLSALCPGRLVPPPFADAPFSPKRQQQTPEEQCP